MNSFEGKMHDGSVTSVWCLRAGGGPQHAQRRRHHGAPQRSVRRTYGDRQVPGAVRSQRQRCRQRRLVGELFVLIMKLKIKSRAPPHPIHTGLLSSVY